MNNPVLHISNLSKHFAISRKGMNMQRAEVLSSLHLIVERGQLNTILGSNGAGKTTLFNIISGFEECRRGEIMFYPAGRKPVNLLRLDASRRARAGIGRLLQGTSVFGNLNLEENILMAQKPVYAFGNLFDKTKHIAIEKKKIISKAADFLANTGMDYAQSRNRKAASLSAASQRLLAFAMLYVSEAELLLLDEPCSGIHHDQLPEIAEALRMLLSEQKTVLLIEHNLDFVSMVPGTCHYLSEGKIRESGTTEDIIFMYKSEQGC